MNIGRAIIHAASRFSSRSIQDSHIEARMLLCHLLKVPPAGLYTYPERLLSEGQLASMENMIERRLSGEPLAYILQQREFYSLSFYVDSNVLIPRQETELLVEHAVHYCRMAGNGASGPIMVADIGTGCGAIAVSMAVSLPNIKIYAVDISGKALEVAGINAAMHGVENKIDFMRGDLMGSIPEAVDLLCANLPYIRSGDLSLLPSCIIGHEPLPALDGGADGLDLIRRLVHTAHAKIKPHGCMLLEIGYDQSETVANLVKASYPAAALAFHKDLNGHRRVAEVRFCP